MPAARADLVAPSRPHRHLSVGLAHALPRLAHGAAVGLAHVANGVVMHGAVRGPVHGHLILLPQRLAHRVTMHTDVLVVDRPIGGPAHGHLILLPQWLAHRVTMHTDMLLVDRVVGGPVHRHLILLD